MVIRNLFGSWASNSSFFQFQFVSEETKWIKFFGTQWRLHHPCYTDIDTDWQMWAIYQYCYG